MNAPVVRGSLSVLIEPVEPAATTKHEAHAWVGSVLDHFAKAEQALGRLSIEMGLPISNGSLSSLPTIRERLENLSDKRTKALNQRIARWSANRPFRHLLAHATILQLQELDGTPVIVTRHLPRDPSDVTPDRVWTLDEQKELLRQASNDGRSISDHVRNVIADPKLLATLRSR